MNKRRIGNSDLNVAPLAFGGNVFGWTIDEPTSFQLLDAFVGNGFNFIDTADVYSTWVPGNKGGESETIIGNWMKKNNNRDKIVIATKVGGDMGQGKKDISKKYILKAAAASLKRLQTDYIDLYQTHWDDNVTPVEETLDAYAQLIKEGKIRWIGASNFSPERLAASVAAGKKFGYPVYQSYQPEYNLCERGVFEKSYEKICTDNHLGVITYFSLASGFLTGKYRNDGDLSKSARGARAKNYMNDKGFAILNALDDVAMQYRSTPASIALAWLMARPAVTAPIASATSISQLNELMKSTGLQLGEKAIELLDEVSSK
ncbi:MAG: aldo/keto reductase [Ferruginibacter sp.]